MAIVKGCNLTPGCVFTVRGGGAAGKEMAVCGRLVACGETTHPVGAHSSMRLSTGSPLRADTGAAPTKSAGENHSV